MTFVGQNIGARKYKRILPILGNCVLLVTLIGASLGALVYVFRLPLLSIYTSAEDPTEMLNYGMIRLSIIATTYFMCGIMEALTGVLRGMGSSFTTLIISLTGACGLRVLWIYTFFAANRTLATLYWSYPVSWLLTSLMQLVALFFIYRSFIRKRDNESADKAVSEK
jgi:Na+-driven multidrug efflux pump